MLASDFHCLSFESPWSWSPSSSSLRPPRRLRRRRLGRRHRLRRPGRRGPRRLPRRVAGGRGVAAGAGARLSARHVQRALTGGMAGRPHGQMCVRPRCRNHANAVAVPGAGGAVVLFESDSASAALKTAVRPIQASHDTAATRWHSWPMQRTHNRVLATLGVVVVSAGEPQKSGSGGDRYFAGRAMAGN